MSDPHTYHFKLPQYQGARLPEPPHAWYPASQEHHPFCTSLRTLRSDGRIRAFVIHATAGPTSPGAMSVMFEHRASWHWLVPSEAEAGHGRHVWACAPEKRAAWHVRNSRSHQDVNNGSRNVNYWSLGVEIVNTQVNDPFSDWQVEQTAALVRYAWSKYPDLVDVVSHAKLDPSRRTDPGVEFPWNRFRELVLTTQESIAVPPSARSAPIQILGLDDQAIDCDVRWVDGVLMADVNELANALGFQTEYDSALETSREFDETTANLIRLRPMRREPHTDVPDSRRRRTDERHHRNIP
jgi:N-acetyl-anhydromuramyl-L-alanine amidase AmpD